MLNAPFAPATIGGGNPYFSSPICGKNNRFDGFFLTVATGWSFCAGSSLEKGWDTVGHPQSAVHSAALKPSLQVQEY
jgi:hypothetical protein